MVINLFISLLIKDCNTIKQPFGTDLDIDGLGAIIEGRVEVLEVPSALEGWVSDMHLCL